MPDGCTHTLLLVGLPAGVLDDATAVLDVHPPADCDDQPGGYTVTIETTVVVTGAGQAPTAKDEESVGFG